MRSSGRACPGIRSACCWGRQNRGCRSWCRSGMAGCWCRRSRSTGERHCRWRRIWPPLPRRGCGCSCAGTLTCPISARSPRRNGGWSSTSTTSTRRCPARSSGTSSGWPRAWRWPGGTTGSPPKPGARSPSRRPRATARRCVPSRSSPSWTSGMRTWTSSRPCASSGPRSRPTGPRSSPIGSRPPRLCWPRPTPATARRPWISSPPWSTGGGGSSVTPRWSSPPKRCLPTCRPTRCTSS